MFPLPVLSFPPLISKFVKNGGYNPSKPMYEYFCYRVAHYETAEVIAMLSLLAGWASAWLYAPLGRATLRHPIRPAFPRLVASELRPGDDLWSIVGAPRGSTKEEIRKAYRARARKLHPDMNQGAEASSEFRRLVEAFELLIDQQKRSAWEGQTIRGNARERARKAWEDVKRSSREQSWDPGASSPSDRPAGSRREAEQEDRFQSNERRRRWREKLIMEIWRDYMPVEVAGSEESRVRFVAKMELLVAEFSPGSAPADASPSRSPAASWADIEAEETRKILEVGVREVIEAEMQDARHRTLKHRERARWLEGQLDRAEKRAEMWRAAAPASRADRIQAMERELAFLELAGRLRERLHEQRLALELLKRRESMLLDSLSASRRD
ncbi:MAG: hypothetical protein SGPRY_003155 [Prymnesium sp.]